MEFFTRSLTLAFHDRFSDLTGTDYSEEAIEHARNLAVRNGFSQINFLVRFFLSLSLSFILNESMFAWVHIVILEEIFNFITIS